VEVLKPVESISVHINDMTVHEKDVTLVSITGDMVQVHHAHTPLKGQCWEEKATYVLYTEREDFHFPQCLDSVSWFFVSLEKRQDLLPCLLMYVIQLMKRMYSIALLMSVL
jgi:hypothetical protein